MSERFDKVRKGDRGRYVATALLVVMGVFAFCASQAGASAILPFEWRLSGPLMRFSGVASSSDGAIAFAVPDPSCGGNPGARGFRSMDHGATWSEMTSMPELFWLSVDSSASGQIVFATGSDCAAGVLTQSAVYRSTDFGTTWSVARAFDPSAPGTVYGDVSTTSDGQKVVVGSNAGVVYSNDAGSTWTAIDPVPNLVASSVAMSGDGTRIMVSESYGPIYSSTSAGATWSVSDPNPRNWSNVELSTDGQSALAVATRQDGIVDGGAFVSHDGGGTWSDPGLNSSFVDIQFATGAMSPDGNTMIASSYYSVPRISTDGGATWSVLPTYIAAVINEGWTAFAVSDPDVTNSLNPIESRVFAVTENHYIARLDFPELFGLLPETGSEAPITSAVLVTLAGFSLVSLATRVRIKGR